MGVKGNTDIIEIIQKKILHWYGHVKRMSEERTPKLIMDWMPEERRKRGPIRKTWMEGVQARELEQDQWETERNGVWFVGDGDSCYRTG
jgi:hypothetical protein